MIAAENVVDVSREPLHKLRLQNNLVRAYWVDLAPGIGTQFHAHQHPYAGICLGDSLIRNEIIGEGVNESRVREGDVIYTPGTMTHRIENIGAGAFQNVTVEILRSAGHSTSSVKRLQRERRNVEVVIDASAMYVANLTLAAGERCDLIGDHLVIRLSGRVSTSTFAERQLLQRSGDFAWCCGVATLESAEGGKVAIVEIR